MEAALLSLDGSRREAARTEEEGIFNLSYFSQVSISPFFRSGGNGDDYKDYIVLLACLFSPLSQGCQSECLGEITGLWVATGFGNVLKKAKGVWSWEISGVSYGFGVELLLNHDFHQVHLHCSASSPFVN